MKYKIFLIYFSFVGKIFELELKLSVEEVASQSDLTVHVSSLIW